MVHVSDADLKGVSELREYLSEESDTDIENEDFNDNADIEAPVPLHKTFENVILICGLPSVGEEKYQKLCEAVSKKIEVELINRDLITSSEESDESPFTVDVLRNEETKETTGVAFVTFADVDIARQASKFLGQTGLGQKHPFKVCRLDDFEETITPDDDLPRPVPVGFEKQYLRDWLNDPLGREQYGLRFGAKIGLNWHDPVERTPQAAFSANETLGRSFCWSPQGSYLVTFHKLGVALRGAQEKKTLSGQRRVEPFVRLVRLDHPRCTSILFSPDERYLITWDGTSWSARKDMSVIVWEVLTGKQLRTFRTPQFSCSGVRTDDGGAWPFFVFSHDGNYLAMRREKDIVVFELPSMTVLEDKRRGGRVPLSYPLDMFQWSPASNLLSIWCPESGDTPGRLLLVDIPSREERASKNVFNVRSVSMHWQPRGDLMALRTVLIRKKGKKLRQEVTQLEIFRVKQRSVPVDTITIESGRVKALVWEKGPLAMRFATLETDGDSGHCLKFYVVRPAGSRKEDTELVASFPVASSINVLEWSPAGQYFLAANRGSEGTLIFGCLTEANKLEIFHRDEHQDLTDIFWDPSGRYVTTAVLVTGGDAAYRYTANAGYRIYSFLGRLQQAIQDPETTQFLWRPRPPTLLSQAKIEEVQKKLRDYSRLFDQIDEERKLTSRAQMAAEAEAKHAAFWAKVDKARNALKAHPKAAEWQQMEEELAKIMEWEETVDVTEEFLETWTVPVNAAAA